MTKKIASVVGSRPQFIKVSVISSEIRKYFNEVLIHSGQHYDYELSLSHFQNLDIPEPDYNLEIGSGSHPYQIGTGIIKIEEVLMNEKPDLVLLIGDTNATISGAITAAKMDVPIAHVEAGIRHYDWSAPEESNRIVTDHLSSLFFCSSPRHIATLESEGLREGIHLVGDVLMDVMIESLKYANSNTSIINQLEIIPQQYYLATVHRPINTDNVERLTQIFESFCDLNYPVVVPLHPRTNKALKILDIYNEIDSNRNVILTKPLSYLDFLTLEKKSRLIITDSGGVQREAYFLGIPCVTLYERCPWPETVDDGWNVIIFPTRENIISAINNFDVPDEKGTAYGDGTASKKIVSIIKNFLD